MCNFLHKKGFHNIRIALHFPLSKYYSMAAIIYVCGYKNAHISKIYIYLDLSLENISFYAIKI